MRYWDTSALVPLVVEEPGTELVRRALDDDPLIATWGLTRLELVSSVERAAREGRLSAKDRRLTLDAYEELAGTFHEVTDLLAVRVRAASLLARHAIRAADAAQLGAALLVADPDPSSLTIVVLDRRLADAAAREGLRVETWPA